MLIHLSPDKKNSSFHQNFHLQWRVMQVFFLFKTISSQSLDPHWVIHNVINDVTVDRSNDLDHLIDDTEYLTVDLSFGG